MDADIKGAFDHIHHDFLLERILRFPGRHLIKSWMKAGVMEKASLSPTWEGVPQGGVISPLLLNIALHGMEKALGLKWKKRGDLLGPRALIRYADDLVILCESQQDALLAQEELSVWLQPRGLELSAEKTRVVHLSEGFDFLGFTIRQHQARNRRQGWIVLTRPSKAAVKKLKRKLKEVWIGKLGHPVLKVIQELNPVVRGWSNYYRHVVSSRIFAQLDSWMFQRAYRLLRRTHPQKSFKWLRARYWRKWNQHRQDQWVLGDPMTGSYLTKFGWTSIERYFSVKGTASPDDPQLRAYWENRQKSPVQIPRVYRKLLFLQNHRCPVCKEHLLNGEEIQQHHKIPSSKGGTDDLNNLMVVHLYCHQQIHGVKGKET